MRDMKILGIAALFLLAASAAPAQTVIPLGAAAEGPRSVTAQAVPAAPSNLQAFAVSGTQINLSWVDNAANEEDFKLEMRTSATEFDDIAELPGNTTSAQVLGLSPGTTYFFRVRARNDEGFSPFSNVASATTTGGGGGGACAPSATAMCLNNNRFRVEAAFQTNTGLSGPAQAVKLTDDSGYFWFFNAANIELIVKVLNGCPVNNRFWVFAGGLTNVQVQIIVTDTATGIQRRYDNPQNTPFRPLQDTNAFSTCP